MLVHGLLLATAAAPPGLVPEPPTAAGRPALRWDAPPQCPDERAVTEAVSRYVGRPLASETVTATGRVDTTADGYALELRLTGSGEHTETRAVQDADCALLADVAALMVAIAIDPKATTLAIEMPDPPLQSPDPAPIEPRDEAPVEPQPEPEPQPDPAAAPEPPAAEDEPPRALRSCRPGPSGLRHSPRDLRPSCGALGLRVALQAGALPQVGPGIGLDASLLWPRVSIVLGASFFFDQPARLEQATALGGDIRSGFGHVRACGRLGWNTLEFPLCGGVEVGALRGVGVGIDTPRDDRLGWFAAVADAGLAWSPTRRFALGTRVGPVVPLVRPSFEIAGLGAVFEPAPVGLRAALTAEVRFP
ncbi:MAG: hypothetical protein AAF799_08435 [Myxococcota bacterium]